MKVCTRKLVCIFTLTMLSVPVMAQDEATQNQPSLVRVLAALKRQNPQAFTKLPDEVVAVLAGLRRTTDAEVKDLPADILLVLNDLTSPILNANALTQLPDGLNEILSKLKRLDRGNTIEFPKGVIQFQAPKLSEIASAAQSTTEISADLQGPSAAALEPRGIADLGRFTSDGEFIMTGRTLGKDELQDFKRKFLNYLKAHMFNEQEKLNNGSGGPFEDPSKNARFNVQLLSTADVTELLSNLENKVAELSKKSPREPTLLAQYGQLITLFEIVYDIVAYNPSIWKDIHTESVETILSVHLQNEIQNTINWHVAWWQSYMRTGTLKRILSVAPKGTFMPRQQDKLAILGVVGNQIGFPTGARTILEIFLNQDTRGKNAIQLGPFEAVMGINRAHPPSDENDTELLEQGELLLGKLKKGECPNLLKRETS